MCSHEEPAPNLNELWRGKLAEAQRLYETDRNPETLRNLREILTQFADLVVRGVIPKTPATDKVFRNVAP